MFKRKTLSRTISDLLILSLIILVGCSRSADEISQKSFMEEYSTQPINEALDIEVAPHVEVPKNAGFNPGNNIPLYAVTHKELTITDNEIELSVLTFNPSIAKWEIIQRMDNSSVTTISYDPIYKDYFFSVTPIMSLKAPPPEIRIVIEAALQDREGNIHEEIAYIDIPIEPIKNIEEQISGTWQESPLHCTETGDVNCPSLLLSNTHTCEIDELMTALYPQEDLQVQQCVWKVHEIGEKKSNEGIPLIINTQTKSGKEYDIELLFFVSNRRNEEGNLIYPSQLYPIIFSKEE